MKPKIKKQKQPKFPLDLILIQIYGELNRIRLILGDNTERGKSIVAFDRENNGYNPFFESKEKFEEYHYMKNEREELNSKLRSKKI